MQEVERWFAELPPFTWDPSGPYVWGALVVIGFVFAVATWLLTGPANEGASRSVAPPQPWPQPSSPAEPTPRQGRVLAPICTICAAGNMLPRNVARYGSGSVVAGWIIGIFTMLGAFGSCCVGLWPVSVGLLLLLVLCHFLTLKSAVLACNRCGYSVPRASP